MLEVSTVKSHVHRTVKKPHLADRAKAVVFAHDVGLVRPGRRWRMSSSNEASAVPDHTGAFSR